MDCTLAPVERGGGIKVKVLESLSRGRAVLGTSFAFDGFDPGLRARYLTEVGSPDQLKLAVFRLRSTRSIV